LQRSRPIHIRSKRSCVSALALTKILTKILWGGAEEERIG
jgi:hypothetical protein